MAITNETLATLDDLRLPDLWTLWVEIHGEPTRNPNRRSLIARLRPEIEARLALAALPELVIGDTVEVASGWDGAGTRGTVKEVIPMPEGGPTLQVEWADGRWTHSRAIRLRRVEQQAPPTPDAETAPQEPPVHTAPEAELVPESAETHTPERAEAAPEEATADDEPAGAEAPTGEQAEPAAPPAGEDEDATAAPADRPAPRNDAEQADAPAPTATAAEKKLTKMTSRSSRPATARSSVARPARRTRPTWSGSCARPRRAASRSAREPSRTARAPRPR